MPFIEFFSSIFWTCMVLIVWFKTDAVIHYCELFNICEQMRLKYYEFVVTNNTSFFPDFLYNELGNSSNRICRFFGKLISCPYCLGFWVSAIACLLLHTPFILLAGTYVCSIFIYLQISKLF